MQELAITNQQTAPPAGWAYASFSARATAFSIDQFILLLIVIVFTLPIFILLGFASLFVWPFFVVFVPTFCSFRVPAGWAYFALQESSRHQATFGKRVCGIHVRDIQGNRISLFRATLRHFGKYVSAAIMLMGFVMAAFTERHQALHDLLADTLVLKKAK